MSPRTAVKLPDLRAFISKHKIRSSYIVTHRLADVDAYCSAYALSKLLRSFGSRVVVVLPEGINMVGQKVGHSFHMNVDNDPAFSKADLIVILDTNNPALLSTALDGIVNSGAKKLLLDHHPPARNTATLGATALIDTGSSSTSEIIYRVYRSSNTKISASAAQALLVGVMADSQHFFLATNRTIEVVNDLCRQKASLEKARKILAREREISERMARLKAARRVSLYRAGKYVIALSHVGSFHASAAKGMVDLGADLAIVLGSDEEKSKASLRATSRFYEESGLHLGTDIASKLSDAGGGHPTAASLTSNVKEEELGKTLLLAVQARLGDLIAVK